MSSVLGQETTDHIMDWRAYLATLQEQERRAAKDSLAIYAGLHIPAEVERDDLPALHELPVAARYIPAQHHRLIISLLERVERGEIRRLAISAPPGSAKSSYTSMIFPAWCLGRHPDWSIIAASQTQELADRFGRRARNLVGSQTHTEVFGSGLAPDQRAAGHWETAKGGEYHATGVQPFAGRRADGVICLRPGTELETCRGRIPIEQVVSGDWVLSYAEHEHRAVYRPVTGIVRRKATEYWRIHSAAGSVVEATGNHQFYVGDGWREASAIAVGDVLLRAVRNSNATQGLRLGKKVSQRRASASMQSIVCWVTKHQAAFMQWVRQAGFWQTAAHMFGCVLDKDYASRSRQAIVEGFGRPGMFVLQSNVSSQSCGATVLQQGMCGTCSCSENATRKQSGLAGWIKSGAVRRTQCASIPGNQAQDSGTRRTCLCGLWRDGCIACTSCESRSYGQSLGESSNALQELSYEVTRRRAFNPESDSVALVERVREPTEVYDIQVADTNCFFANDILVHNCDDLLRGRKDAESKLVRESVWEWYLSDIRPRLKPGAWLVMIATRWHDDDPIGRILPPEAVGKSGWYKSRDGEDWYVLSLAAVIETVEQRDNDPLGRQIGDILWPEWFTPEMLEQERRTQGARNWAALYQQNPRPHEGAILKRVDWRQWPGDKPPKCEYVVSVYDTAFEEGEENDYTARTTWGVFWHEEERPAELQALAKSMGKLPPTGRYCCVLLERFKDRVEFPKLRVLALKHYKEFKPDRVLIEKKASGHSLIQEMRRAGVPVGELKADRSKLARAHAASAVLESGCVFYLPRKWADEVRDECEAFPAGEHDDITDTCVHAWIWLRRTFHLQLREEDDEDEVVVSKRRFYG